MTTTPKQQQLAADILKIVQADDGRFDQSVWFEEGREIEHPCETSACVAGWAASLSGYRAHTDEYGWVMHFVGADDPTERGAIALGQELLGLDDDTALWLFDSDRGDFEVIDALERLSQGEPVEWEKEFEVTYTETISRTITVMARDRDAAYDAAFEGGAIYEVEPEYQGNYDVTITEV